MPLIFGLRNALLLEPPSTFQRQLAKSAEEERLHMRDFEYKMLNLKNKNGLPLVEAIDSSDADGVGDQVLGSQDLKTNGARRGTVSKDKVQFKKKRAKVIIIISSLFFVLVCCLRL